MGGINMTNKTYGANGDAGANRDLNRNVIVIGSGVAGVKCAFSLADMGYHVNLLDKEPYLGGKISRLYKQFPTNDCGWCKVLPQIPGATDKCTDMCLRRSINHKNIRLLPFSEITSIHEENSGENNDEKNDGGKKNPLYKVEIRRKTRYVSEDKCIACGLCVKECPVSVPDEYNSGFTLRKAIWIRNGGPVPRIATVDMENCTKCGRCVEICPTRAVDLSMKDTSEKLECSSIVIATGYEESTPDLTQYGYGRFPNVLTNMELERKIGGDGGGEIDLSGRKIGIIQCVGSRSEKNDYCSYACCMYALKEAIMLKETFPTCDITIYYMDMRTFGKDYYRYQKDAEKLGIKLVLCRVPAVDSGTDGRVSVKWTDEENINSAELDYAILSIGQKVPEDTKKLIAKLGVKHDEYGFIHTSSLSPVETSKRGIYVCGSASGPKDIPESITEALAVAAKIASEHPIRNAGITGTADGTDGSYADAAGFASDKSDTSGGCEAEMPEHKPEKEKRIAVFLCACGIAKDRTEKTFDAILDALKERKEVVAAEKMELLCRPEQIEKMLCILNEKDATRVLIAACAPYQFGSLFVDAVSSLGINPKMVDITDIRELGFWADGIAELGAGSSGKEFSEHALELSSERIKKLVMSSLARLSSRVIIPETPMKVTRKVLVVGGGIAGMNSASIIAGKGIPVTLVEKSGSLGGNANLIRRTIDGCDVTRHVREQEESLKKESNINVLTESEITRTSGYCGNFTASIKTPSGTIEDQFGAVIIATGGKEYTPGNHVPNEYGYGTSRNIVTLTAFEKLVSHIAGKTAGHHIHNAGSVGRAVEGHGTQDVCKPKTVAMIQCVGSRDSVHPYCSRVCCSSAIKNALELKKHLHDTDIYILHRDIMTYGLSERYYSEARKSGINFIRFPPDDPPKVTTGDGQPEITVTVSDHILGKEITIQPDILVLSTGIIPEDHKTITSGLSIQTNADGFICEANPKFRPVDTLRDGVFICGLAHSPRTISETIIQSLAASAQAIATIENEKRLARNVTSTVSERWCIGCGMCIEACPYGARAMDEDKQIARVIEPLCRGCGVCAVVCPSEAARLIGYRRKGIMHMIDEVI